MWRHYHHRLYQLYLTNHISLCFTEEDHVKEYAKAKYGWLDIPDTPYGDNASTDDNSISDAPDITTPNISPKQQTAILPDDAMSSIVTVIETNISQTSQHQRHPKKVLIKMEDQEEQQAHQKYQKLCLS